MSSAACDLGWEQVEQKLDELAEEISADLAQLESSQRKELLSDFVSKLFLNAEKQNQKELRCQRQAAGIAAARARGVRFGRAQKPLPENFIQYYKAWQDGQMTAAQAAEACGITKGAFYNATYRVRRSEDCPV